MYVLVFDVGLVELIVAYRLTVMLPPPNTVIVRAVVSTVNCPEGISCPALYPPSGPELVPAAVHTTV